MSRNTTEVILDTKEKKDQQIIGFIGDDFYEAILLFAFTKINMGNSVLLLDYSKEKKLIQCLPVPIGQDILYDVINYKGIEYTSKEMFNDELKYNCVLVYFGFQRPYMKCDQWIIVSNQEHLIQRKILNMLSETELKGRIILVLHDIVAKMNNEQFYNSVLEKVKISDYVELEIDYRYYEQRVKCQKGNFYFLRVPNELTKFLFSLIYQFESDKKKVKMAYKKAKGGHVIDNTILEHSSWPVKGVM